MEAAKWQLLLYLKVLKDKGVERKGKLEFVEKNKTANKVVYVEITEENYKQLNEIIKDIEALLDREKAPEVINEAKCKKCSYYEYCYI
ncbi:hypothetical protein SDC9_104592 [bioreactor metagenome]|uniref:DUF83 domain-containing protein n=1 Tax=bioreactor metagenome TaxID=1076179 RepID=A0A645AXE6_9ZZZZ